MTNSKDITPKKEKTGELRATLTSVLIIFIFVIISYFLSDELSEAVISGLELCFYTVIGAIFPFLILCDIMLSFSHFDRAPLFRRTFTKLFKINGYAVSAYLCGILCGFPIGIKVSRELYDAGYISKEECERLIGFSNNTGPSFVISGIGLGLRNSITDGILLYLSMIISSVAVGIILGIGHSPTDIIAVEKKQGFDLNTSVRKATASTVSICGFVVFFSAVCGVLELWLGKYRIYPFLLPLFEVSNASRRLADISYITNGASLILTAFAVSFSGLSVHMQGRSFLENSGISMKKYYLAKLLQGTISSLFITLILLLFPTLSR
jgi:sporulation integral membrane protein YlbJ